MKKLTVKLLTILPLMLISAPMVQAQHDHGSEKKESHHVKELANGPHGGTVEEAKPYHAEILIKDGEILLYLLDADAKKMGNKDITGEATFTMSDGKSIKETLTAYGDDGFIVRNKDLLNYSNCLVVFLVEGKNVSAKFNNYSNNVQHEKSYSCPMHPGIKSDKAGKCSECGMNLVEDTKNGSEQHHH